ncbi:MAG: hypothetical protein C5B54_11510 [Acidobacteria bacterium]|nr:MAG: hypothetical protein C5B54_11510 [Acidobacteriota bacterium]
MKATKKVLIVDDDISLAEALTGLLEHAGYRVVTANNSSSALDAVRRDPTDLALMDLRLGQESGLELLAQVKSIRPEMSVIMITGMGKIEDAVEAMKLGADNFVTKPIDPERLLTIVKKGFENRGLRYRTAQLERLNRPQMRTLLSVSKGMTDAIALADAVAERDTTVLLRGETGSGKGLLAIHIHRNSTRHSQPFVELNCAGLQRDLTESELFGHEKGAFTGAVERKIGLFEAADGGTLFLDEIGEMDLSVQAKLLKVLEQKRFRRVGGTAEIEVDVRLIAATHRDLAKDVADTKFREDLFYRLNVFSIQIPALRERKDDILPLALNFLSEFRGGSDVREISKEAGELLKNYPWPGNVRELRNVIERAAILCPPGAAIQPNHLPTFGATRSAETASAGGALTMEEAEKKLLEMALASHDYNLKATAGDLGISRGTLYRKIKKYNIPVQE